MTTRIPIQVPASAIERLPDGRLRLRGVWKARLIGADGVVKAERHWKNLITDQGVNHALGVVLAAQTQDTTWFIGLTDGTPTVAAGDTLASHAGWVEVEDFDEATRQAWTPPGGAVSGKSVTNSASVATFTLSATVTVGGAFLAADSTKGGTTGVLFAAGAFTAGDVAGVDGDTVEVTATYTGADDGA